MVAEHSHKKDGQILGCDFEKEEERNNFSSKTIGPLIKDLTGYETSFRAKVAVFRRKQEFEFQRTGTKGKGRQRAFQ